MECESDDKINHDFMMITPVDLLNIQFIMECVVYGELDKCNIIREIKKTEIYPDILKKIKHLKYIEPGFKKARLNWEDCDYDSDAEL
jgi:hypothetical protein